MDQKQPLQKPIDSRCPRKLPTLPDSWCSLAVQRLKALRNADHELTEEEEANLPGCNWSCSHQMSNYCFFNFMENFSREDKALSDMEIAHFLNVSVDTVKKTEKKALAKLRDAESIKEVKEMYGNDAIVDDTFLEVEWEIPK